MFNGCLMENLMMNSCISGCPICRQTQRGHNLVQPSIGGDYAMTLPPVELANITF